MEALRDSWGREIKSVRVSVTDKCNFRCTYCMPAEGLEWLGRKEILSFEEIARLVGVLARLGVDEVRLTGGEPLVRKDLPVLVGMLAHTDGVRDLSLTTTGVLLDRLAGPLVEAGLQRLNVSLDSLNHVRFAEITRRDALDAVLRGLEEAEHYPELRPIKVNCVAVKGSPRRKSRRSRSWRGANRTSSASSSSCRSTRTRPGARTTSSRALRSARSSSSSMALWSRCRQRRRLRRDASALRTASASSGS